MSKTVLPDPRRTPRFAGLTTFGRYPRLEDVVKESKPVDWVVYGVPFDGGVTYRPGARFGPRAIRTESQYLKRYSIEQDIDVCDLLSLADGGDAPVTPYSCKENAETVVDFATAIDGGGKSAATRLLALGGDHTIAFANIRATWERQGRPKGGLALIHFDSHLDTVDAVWGEKWGHASVFRRAIEQGFVNPARMLSIGIKGPLNTREDLDFARDCGVTILTYADFRARGGAAVSKFLRALGSSPAYLTFDIDCIDPAFAPGTGTPSVGGFTSAEVLAAIRLFAGVDIVGADVVEVLPDRDPQGITALLAAHIAFEVFAIAAARRSGKGRRLSRAAKRG
jgi:agmatinase